MAETSKRYVVGIDFGTLSGRVVLVRVADVATASKAMGGTRRGTYEPDPDRVRAYDRLYEEYRRLHDYLGRGGNDVMLRLRAIRDAARGGDR